MRILVLGAGLGGLELTTRLSGELGDAVNVVLIDKPTDRIRLLQTGPDVRPHHGEGGPALVA
jgi:hypothetical protein